MNINLNWTLDTQETLQTTGGHTRNTPGCISPCFSTRKTPGMHFAHLYAPHDIIAAKMMPPSGRGHTHQYTV